MTRKVFFSFHYERDVWRVNQVRNSWVTKDIEDRGFIDKADFETLERQGKDVIEKWIDDQMNGTSVTVVLIGYQTATRNWVNYEIEKTINSKKGIIGIAIHNVKDDNRMTDPPGRNPLESHFLNGYPLSSIFRTYDWVYNYGRDNIGSWIEEAYNLAIKLYN